MKCKSAGSWDVPFITGTGIDLRIPALSAVLCTTLRVGCFPAPETQKSLLDNF